LSNDRRTLTGGVVFLAGFAVIVVFGKVGFPRLADTLAVPNGMYLQGVIVGLLSSLLAIGIVLIYRSNRIINFAQGALGAVAATLANELAVVYHVPYAISLITGIVAGVAVSLIVEYAFIRRFAKAPRLILTVATIGIFQILSLVEFLPALLNRDPTRAQRAGAFRSPFTAHFTFGSFEFSADHIIALVAVPVILVALAWFFTRTRYGVATRATAENSERARLLGCRVKRVSFLVWGIAGSLSAVTAVLRAPILGFQYSGLQGPGLLLRGLAAAVLGRMESIPATVAAAVLITMGEQTIFFSFGKTGYTDAFVLGVVVVGLLAQRKRFGRVDPGTSSWRSVEEVRPVPRELVPVREVRWGLWGARLATLAVVLTLPLYLNSSRTNLATVILIYAIVGLSLVILTGWSGNISLGQWAIAGVGALVTQRLAAAATPPDFFIILLIAGLSGAAVSFLIGLPALRIRGLFLGVTTLAFAVAAETWIFQWDILQTSNSIQRPALFGVLDTTSERAFFYVTFVGLVFALFVARNLRRSRWGRNLIAMRDNEVQAQALGMRMITMRLSAFAISGFLAALAGALYAYAEQSVDYSRFVSPISLLMFSMVVIGGMGSLAGPILGAIYVLGIQYFLPADLQLFATGFGLLILLLVFPGGLGQILYGLRDRFLREIAGRKDILVPSLIADRLQPEPIAELAEAEGLGAKEEAKIRRKAKEKVLAQTRGGRS
jgi:ABC-type branched-subunit amino acid transport system permease subunit